MAIEAVAAFTFFIGILSFLSPCIIPMIKRSCAPVALVLILLTPLLSAATLPAGLQAAFEQTLSDAQKITFLLAFLGGVISFLSPCILPILPAFFSYSFKTKASIAKMTFIFFLGFSLSFVLLGIAASYLGQSVNDLQANYSFVPVAAGALLILLGSLTVFGNHLPALNFKLPINDNPLSVFAAGFLIVFGWTACIGPILGGILVVASTFSNPLYSALLLFSYSLGIFVPLLALALLSDRIRALMKTSSIAKFVHAHNRLGPFMLTNLIAGLLLIALGAFMIVDKGTSSINTFDPLGTKPLFYELQREVVKLGAAAEIIGALLLIAVAATAFFLFARKGKNSKGA